jgi:putative membrane protein
MVATTIAASLAPIVATWHGHGWTPWFLVFPLFWLAVVGILLFVFGRRRRDWHVGSGESVLAERYARGEITEEEFRQRRSVLRK